MMEKMKGLQETLTFYTGNQLCLTSMQLYRIEIKCCAEKYYDFSNNVF